MSHRFTWLPIFCLTVQILSRVDLGKVYNDLSLTTTCTNSAPTNTPSITTTTRTTTPVTQEELLWQYCDWFGNDYFPALVSDAIIAETFQRYSVPHNTHMKMISSTLRSRVLRDCESPLFLPLQTSVIATTFSDQAAVCLSLQVWTHS